MNFKALLIAAVSTTGAETPVATTTTTTTTTTDATTTTTTEAPSTTTGTPLDHETQALSVDVADCSVDLWTPFDLFGLATALETAIASDCLVTASAFDITSTTGQCRFSLSLPSGADLAKAAQCDFPSMRVEYMGKQHATTLPTDNLTVIPSIPFDSLAVRQMVSNGLHAGLKGDASVAWITTTTLFSNVTNSFDTLLSDSKTLTDELQKMFGYTVEVVDIDQDPVTKNVRLGVRPISEDGDLEADILDQVKTAISDPLSSLMNFNFVHKTTTTTTTTTTIPTTTVAPTTEAPAEPNAESGGINVPLVGGLVGGLGGLAALIGTGGFVWSKKRSDRDTTLIPEDTEEGPIVLTPNTRHGAEGLVERTPRTTTPTGFN